MKNLLFYTSHRQLNEIEYSSFFFNQSEILKNNFDVFIHCNNEQISLQELRHKSKFQTKTDILVTSKNSGYKYGHIEALHDLFTMLSKYEMVIHLHPDCYIVKDDIIQYLLNEQFDVAVSPCTCMDSEKCYNTDFFCFKTKINFLNSYYDIFSKHGDDYAPEKFLHEVLSCSKLNILELNRYSNKICDYRAIDNIGLWHEHDTFKIEQYIRSKINL
jgi:hypothetical protein